MNAIVAYSLIFIVLSRRGQRALLHFVAIRGSARLNTERGSEAVNFTLDVTDDVSSVSTYLGGSDLPVMRVLGGTYQEQRENTHDQPVSADGLGDQTAGSLRGV